MAFCWLAMNLSVSISPRYRDPILLGAVLQAGFLLFGLLAFDSGQLLQWTLFAAVIYWIMAALIVSRRPQTPTKWDLIFLRSGFVIILPVSILATSLVWSWRGLH